jgi:thiol:disulfide interchange protein DsbD
LEWPYPKRQDLPPLANYVYEDQVILPVLIATPKDLKTGASVVLHAKADWLICRSECVPGSAELTLSLPVSAEAPQPDPRWAKAIQRARLDLPGDFPDWKVNVIARNRTMVLQVSPPAWARVRASSFYFFPEDGLVMDHVAPEPLVKDSDGSLELSLSAAKEAASFPRVLKGVLVSSVGFDQQGRRLAMNVDSRVAGAGAVGRQEGSDLHAILRTPSSLAWGLFLAFLGGLLLNIMPCVFPVLAVKILGFVEQSAKDGASLKAHGAAYSAGVLVSFWAMAAVLLSLRAGGQSIGWGFQLQSPAVVAALAGLLLALSLMLLGVFELGVSLMSVGGRLSGKDSLAASFASGALAVVLATPCTAPFMGGAVVLALVAPPLAAFAVFTAMAAGMAAPYLVLSWWPVWLRLLPRPGAWMESFKQAMAFPLLATVVWLVDVFTVQTGPDGGARLLAGLLCLGLAAWIYGRWGQTVELSFKRGVARFAVLGALALAVTFGLAGAGRLAAPAGSPASTGGISWEPWSQARLDSLRREGKPVFVDFTAAWCVTCQVNERLVLGRKEIADGFSRYGVAALRADWTSRDPEITAGLAALGSAGVPVYAVYGRVADSAPEVLGSVLTPKSVLEAVERAAR